MEKPEAGIVLPPLNDRVPAGMNADRILHAGCIQLQWAVLVIARVAWALVEELKVTAMDVEGMRHARRIVENQTHVLAFFHRKLRDGWIGCVWLRAKRGLRCHERAPVPSPTVWFHAAPEDV